MTDRAPPDAARLIDLLSGCFIAQAISVAAKLGIADHLAGGPATAAVLARDLGVDQSSLIRVLRLLVAFGVFRREPSGEFANTPVSATLVSAGPDSLRDLAVWWCEEPHWRVYGHLLESVRTGKPAWPAVHGADLFRYLAEVNPESGATFNRAMISFSATTIPAVLAAYDFSTSAIVADVGGGFGHLLAAILAAAPRTRGILFDMPSAVGGAREQFTAVGVDERARVITGSFFDPLPFAADTIVLKHVIHDWPDADCIRILSRTREALAADGRVLLLEMVVPPSDEPHFSKICDIDMLVSVGGRERNPAEFALLCAEAGLRLTRVIPTASVVSILEAVVSAAAPR